MELLVIQTRAVGTNLPPIPWAEERDWVSRLEEEGKIERIYWIPGQGAAAIFKVKDANELTMILQTNPMKPYGGYTVYPLADLNRFISNMQEITPDSPIPPY